MDLDKILQIVLVISLSSLMINALFIIIGNDILKYVVFSVLSLYILIGTSYINQSRKNNINDSLITKQTSSIIFGTIFMIIIITIIFKLIEILKLIK